MWFAQVVIRHNLAVSRFSFLIIVAMQLLLLAFVCMLQVSSGTRPAAQKKVTPVRTSTVVPRRQAYNCGDTSSRGLSLDRATVSKPTSANPSPELKRYAF